MSLNKSSKKILVIDDEIVLGEIMAEVLASHFEHVHYISDAEKVPEHVNSQSYDLILSDLNMPNLDGASLVSLIRSKGYLTPVIFISGNVTLDYTLMALRLGVSDVLEKPVSDGQLLESVTNVLEMQKRKIQLFEKNKHMESTTPESRMIGLFHSKMAKKKVN